MSEILNSRLEVQYHYMIQLQELNDLFFYVTWIDYRREDLRTWYEVTIAVTRYVGPQFVFNVRYGTADSLPTEEKSVEFIKKAMTDCEKSTYEILINKASNESIKCNNCGAISYHPLDVKYRWCFKCETFHFEFVKNNANEQEP